MRDIPALAENEPLHDIVEVMDRQLLDGLKSGIPKARAFLAMLEKEIENGEKE